MKLSYRNKIILLASIILFANIVLLYSIFNFNNTTNLKDEKSLVNLKSNISNSFKISDLILSEASKGNLKVYSDEYVLINFKGIGYSHESIIYILFKQLRKRFGL
jgi:hypothetical protein